MTEDKRFYGIYRGICIDSEDPEDLGRLTLQVPQLFGQDVTNWAPGITGGLNQSQYTYGTFYTTADQAVTGANTATIITHWTSADTNKTYLDGNRIYVEETGDYALQFSAVMAKSTANSQNADIWIRKNGVDIPDSDTSVTLAGSSAESVISASVILDLEAGEYIEFVFSGVSSTTKLVYYPARTAPIRPACPGVIATLSLTGKYKPKPGTLVWVSFIDGDPNFPVWMGAY